MADDDSRWRLTRNSSLGIMWGPVPIGLLVLLGSLIFVFIYFYIIVE